MKKLVSVNLEWKEGAPLTMGPMHILTVTIGKTPPGFMPFVREATLYPSDRGFIAGNENPPVFIEDLNIAKKRAEKQVLDSLK